MSYTSVKIGLWIAVLVALIAAGAWFVRGGTIMPATGAPPVAAKYDHDSQSEPSMVTEPIASKSSRRVSALTDAPDYDVSIAEELNQLVLQDRLPELLDRAKRDPSMAYALSLALAQCAMADDAYASLSASADKLGGVDKAQARMKEFEHVFAKCKGMQGTNLELRYDLVTSAANAGLQNAQINYRTMAGQYVLSGEALRRPSVAQEYHDNVVRFTTLAAKSGHPDALMAAFDLYSDGMFIPPDKVAAYRYLSAYAHAKPGTTSRKALAAFSAALTPEELKRATAP